MKLIILDRDGVINEDSDEFVKTVDEWRPIRGSLEAIVKLNKAGYLVVIATNQSGISRGYFTLETLHAMHRKMNKELSRMGGHVDAVFFCPHGPKDKCDCRKPKAGLLKEISKRYQRSLEGVPVVGDSYRDLEAALQVSAQPILVKTGKGIRTLNSGVDLSGIPVFDDLAAVAEQLING
ncbi:MAG: D-glycero-beta-D-manno-heptose 1,7-bisphosphate 7-phosphatase [Gammaproteobacteria bacterium]|nr:D-glycero-beta-D-manno-heptose 1,7-bisphosphate 7-phosphatase [Gammaproteobacteria bacterium]